MTLSVAPPQHRNSRVTKLKLPHYLILAIFNLIRLHILIASNLLLTFAPRLLGVNTLVGRHEYCLSLLDVPLWRHPSITTSDSVSRIPSVHHLPNLH